MCGDKLLSFKLLSDRNPQFLVTYVVVTCITVYFLTVGSIN